MDLNPVSIIAGALSAWALQFAKDHPSIPLNPGDTDKIRKILALFGALIAVALAYLNGRLADGVNWEDATKIIWDFLQMVWAAYLAYQAQIKGKGGGSEPDPVPAAPPAVPDSL